MTTHFAQVASLVTDKITNLLYAPVFVTDRQGVIISSSEPHRVGRRFKHEPEDNWAIANFLRIPLQHEMESGEVIVCNPDTQEQITPRLAQALIELVILQTTQTSQTNQHLLKNQLIYDLLHNSIHDEAMILSRSAELGIDLAPPRAVILVDATDYILENIPEDTLLGRNKIQNNHVQNNQLGEMMGLPDRNLPDRNLAEQQRRTQFVISSIVSFFHLPNDTICADLGHGKIVVLKASDSKNLDPWVRSEECAEGFGYSWANLTALKRAANALLARLRNDTGKSIDIGIGRYHPGVQGLARSYEDARAALSLGQRFQDKNRVHCLGELGIAAFVGIADETTKIDLAKYLLSPLDHEPELLLTLDAFFAEDCCPSSTSKKLSIHRNTLSYRLEKITSLTGLDARRFDEAVQMRLCLLLRSLQLSQSYP
ncbi:MAG: helix-turn-helix domain-containing protein [Oculatellaceae cyanobacterium Prado106]|jgi:carbohydrate diacid regulator|nr:helix-turn-helix domain-containing protein [Oculatellaceae cyanobacterium Prado106]